MFSNVSDEGLLDSSPVVRLEQLQAFLHRLAELESAFRPLIRSAALEPSAPGLSRVVAEFQSSVSRACEAYLNNSSQAERLVYSSLEPVSPAQSLRMATQAAARRAFTRINPRT